MSVISKKRVIISAMIAGLGFFQGCQSQNKQPQIPLDVNKGSLYLNEQPYQQLYIEIDTLEGAKVPVFLIEEIQNFLSRLCLKPGGIKIIQDPPVSFEDKELTIGLMSILCTDGPSDDYEEQPAYLHFFLYNTDAKNIKSFNRNPYVQAQCPTTVFINTDYASGFHDSMKRHIIRHEIGHALGLCANKSHGNGGHCDNRKCLMYWTPDWLSAYGTLLQFPMKDKEFCMDCQKDINDMKLLNSNDHLSFKGPFLVEHKENDAIILLPHFKVVPRGDFAALDWDEQLSYIKETVKQNAQTLMDMKNTEDAEAFTLKTPL